MLHRVEILAFLDKGHILVIVETYRQCLWLGRWDAAATHWLEPGPLLDFEGQPGPDGIAVGVDSLLYAAVYRSEQIKVVHLHGHISAGIDLPVQNPTNHR